MTILPNCQNTVKMTENVASVEVNDLVRQQVLNCHPHLDDIDDIESIGSECSNGIMLAGE